jgi:LysR family transcriptional regulator, flagellar master operon regulator
MDIELLRTYLAVARTRHFGRAADELCVTQSAVSARIRQLEKALGMCLFSRVRNNIQLTAEGRQLQKHAETIVHTWTRARQETGLSEEFSGGLAIGAMWDLWEILLEGWLHRLRKDLPETALQVEAGTRDQLIRRLKDGVIDLAILFEPPYVPGLEIREQGVIRLVLAATQQGLAIGQAFSAGYIMVDWGEAFALEHARLFPDMPAAVLRTSSGTLARRYLELSSGSAYLAEQMLAAGNGGIPLYRVPQAPVIERPVFATYRNGSDRADLVRQALELL